VRLLGTLIVYDIVFARWASLGRRSNPNRYVPQRDCGTRVFRHAFRGGFFLVPVSLIGVTSRGY